MRFSERGVKPKYDVMRAAKAATTPLKAPFFADLEGVAEAHSLDGRMWSVLHEGARKVNLFADDGTLIDELPVRTTWYEWEYLYWGRGLNWILFANEVISHDGEKLTRTPLMYEIPLDENRRTLTPGDALDGRSGYITNMIIQRFGWMSMHTNPFPWESGEFQAPPYLRFQKAHEGFVWLGNLLVSTKGETSPWNSLSPSAWQVHGRAAVYQQPEASGEQLMGYLTFRMNECEASVIDGKLYASAYRWVGRAYLVQSGFVADGSPADVYYLLVTNSLGANASGDMDTTIGTELGKAVITPRLTSFKRGEESIESGPWRSSDGSSVLKPDGAQINLEDGIISSSPVGECVRVAEGAWAEHVVSGGVFAEDLRGLISGAAQTWLNPGNMGGGMVGGLVVGPSRDVTIYTDAEKYNRLVMVGGAALPWQAGNYSVLDSYKEDGGRVYRSRLLRESAVGDLTPDWDEIIKKPVDIEIVESLTGEQWEMADGPLVFQGGMAYPMGYGQYSGSGAVAIKWLTTSGGVLDDSLSYSTAVNEYIRFPICSGGTVAAHLYRDGVYVSSTDVPIPEECAGMWRRNFASDDLKTSDCVGVHCNFQRTRAMNFIGAPAAIIKDGALVGGRVGQLHFYHATTGLTFVLYDGVFVSMVEEMEVSAPTPSTPSPALYVPNGETWLKEYGADSFMDAFGKTRYRKNFAVLTTWTNRRVDSRWNKYWQNFRMIIIKMDLDTEALDLAGSAYACKVNK